MKEIQLTKGKIAIVDDEDYEWLNEWKWFYDSYGYARRGQYNKKTKNIKSIRMHRTIIDAKDGELVDHINRDRLDNRKSNLRICDWSLNSRNRKISKNNTSGYRGVYFDDSSRVIKKWKVIIRLNNKRIYIGRFKTKTEAAKAYNDAAVKYFGEVDVLNKI